MDDIRSSLDAVVRCGYDRSRVFRDWVELMFHAFQRDDPPYLAVMGTYDNSGEMGSRPADHFARATGALLAYMQRTNEEALGQLFMEYAADKGLKQAFTPPDLAKLMAALSLNTPPAEGTFTISDPCCGAGCMLVHTAKMLTREQADRALFVGQDIDPSCVYMTALNLMFFNLNGEVTLGNSLTDERRGTWRTRRNLLLGGSIGKV